MLHLVSSANGEGYFHALGRTWSKCGFSVDETPAKSSFCEFREKVSYKFFEDIFRQDLNAIDLSRKKLRGFYVYAGDGDQLDIAPSADLISQGFRGYHVRGTKKETHYLKIYTAQIYDVVNGLVKDFRHSTTQSETSMAREMAAKLEPNSITIYDRYHCGYPTIANHMEANSHFLIRARMLGDHNVPRAVREFRKSRKKSAWMSWKPQGELWLKPAVKVRLIKARNPKTKATMILVTNIKTEDFSDQEVSQLYLRRWDIEGSFRDLTSTLKLEQWHSTKLNGVLQEIYALLWLANKIKFACFSATKAARDWLMSWEYRKCNFKLCVNVFMDNLPLLIGRRNKEFGKILRYWIERTIESRRRLSRRYPRVVRKRGIAYDVANVVSRRA